MNNKYGLEGKVYGTVTLLIQNGRVFDGVDFSQRDILVRDGAVERITADIPVGADRVFDASGMTVLPGLVDVHMHMAGHSSPNWSVDPEQGCFPFGVTAAADASASRGDRGLMDSLQVKAGVFIITGTKEPFSFDAALERLERYGSRVLGIKVCYDNKLNPDLTDEKKLMAICDFAHSRGLPLAVHTAHSPVPMDVLLSVLSAGDIATHVYHPGPNSADEDGFACLHKARQRGVWLDSCICGNEHVDFRIFREAVAAGAEPDLMGTDLAEEIAFTRGGRYGLGMCMTVARLLGMEEKNVFRAVTGNAGRALRRPWGLLKEGGPADLAVLQWCKEPMDLTDHSGNRIASEHGYRCRLTVANGKIVYEGQ